MSGIHGDIHGGLAVVAFEVKVGAAEEQGSEDIHVSVLGRGVQRSVARLFTDVWIGPEVKQQLDDLYVSG